MIICQNVSKHFGGKCILENFTYTFPKNVNVALVGANGAGKTTFLNMVSGLEELDGGNIIIPKDCKVAYLPQDPCPTPKETVLQECLSGHRTLLDLKARRDEALNAVMSQYSEEVFEVYERLEKEFSDQGGYALEAEAKGILAGLGFEQEQFDAPPQVLSGGWRMRLELAKLLINEPNFLILDEPTNHLDLPSLTWLEQYLKTFRGTLLFVSHDRNFLNNLSDITMHMANGQLRVYKGDFDSFLQQKAEREEVVQKERESLKRQQAHLQSFVDRFRYKATKAKQAQSRLKMIDRLKELESKLGDSVKEQQISLHLPLKQASGRVVLTLDDVSIGYDDCVLQKHLSLKVFRQQKIAIIGANGLGKSTLLKTLIQEIPLLAGQFQWGANVTVGYFSQNQLDVLDEKKTALDNLLALAPETTRQEARTILGSLLLSGDDVLKPISVLSGGEKSKVALAVLLAQRYNCLLLDEPTNHLDMSSIEILGSALKAYEGTVLFVSHNRAFIDAFATHVLTLDRVQKPELITLD